MAATDHASAKVSPMDVPGEQPQVANPFEAIIQNESILDVLELQFIKKNLESAINCEKRSHMAKALAFYNVANDTLGTLGEGYRSDPKMIKIQSLIEERLAMAADEGWSDDRSDHDSDISIPRRRASHSSSDPPSVGPVESLITKESKLCAARSWNEVLLETRAPSPAPAPKVEAPLKSILVREKRKRNQLKRKLRWNEEASLCIFAPQSPPKVISHSEEYLLDNLSPFSGPSESQSEQKGDEEALIRRIRSAFEVTPAEHEQFFADATKHANYEFILTCLRDQLHNLDRHPYVNRLTYRREGSSVKEGIDKEYLAKWKEAEAARLNTLIGKLTRDHPQLLNAREGKKSGRILYVPGDNYNDYYKMLFACLYRLDTAHRELEDQTCVLASASQWLLVAMLSQVRDTLNRVIELCASGHKFTANERLLIFPLIEQLHTQSKVYLRRIFTHYNAYSPLTPLRLRIAILNLLAKADGYVHGGMATSCADLLYEYVRESIAIRYQQVVIFQVDPPPSITSSTTPNPSPSATPAPSLSASSANIAASTSSSATEVRKEGSGSRIVNLKQVKAHKEEHIITTPAQLSAVCHLLVECVHNAAAFAPLFKEYFDIETLVREGFFCLLSENVQVFCRYYCFGFPPAQILDLSAKINAINSLLSTSLPNFEPIPLTTFSTFFYSYIGETHQRLLKLAGDLVAKDKWTPVASDKPHSASVDELFKEFPEIVALLREQRVLDPNDGNTAKMDTFLHRFGKVIVKVVVQYAEHVYQNFIEALPTEERKELREAFALREDKHNAKAKLWRRNAKCGRDFRRIEKNKRLEILSADFFCRIASLTAAEQKLAALAQSFADSAALFSDAQKQLQRAVAGLVQIVVHWFHINVRSKVLDHIVLKSFNKKSKEKLQPALDFLSSQTTLLVASLSDSVVLALFDGLWKAVTEDMHSYVLEMVWGGSSMKAKETATMLKLIEQSLDELKPLLHAKGRGPPVDLLHTQSVKLLEQLASLAKDSPSPSPAHGKVTSADKKSSSPAPATPPKKKDKK